MSLADSAELYQRQTVSTPPFCGCAPRIRESLVGNGEGLSPYSEVVLDVVYRASELGKCSRFLIGKRMGYTEMPPPDKFVGYFARGDLAEEVAREALMQRGFVIETGDHEHAPGKGKGIPVEFQVSSTISVTGHLDGLIHDQDFDADKYVWECKRVSARVFADFVEHGWEATYDLLEAYKWQVSCYMVATGKELMFTVVNGDTVDEGELELHHLYRELPFYDETQIKTRVLLLESLARAGELPDTCDKQMYPCPLYYLPGHDEEDDVDEVVSGLARAVIDAKKESEVASKKEKDLRGQLLTAMGDRKKLRTEVATVSVQKSQRTVTDYDRMRADGWDIADYQTKEDGDEYVRVTPRKGVVKKEDDGTDPDQS